MTDCNMLNMSIQILLKKNLQLKVMYAKNIIRELKFGK